MPTRLPKRDFPQLLEDVKVQLDKRAKRARRRTDQDLHKRAQHLNRTAFQGRIKWEAIRWVSNMNSRLGSCTTSGSTTGHIRISDKIKDWPQWVVDYVIAHEMCHILHPDHSPAFWDTLLAAYPRAEQARGFIKGVGYAKGEVWEED